MRVAIIGAGIGGLSAAVGLARAGAHVTVFERAAEVRAGGSGLSLFANGLRALESLGLGPRLATVTDQGVESLTAGQRRPDGRWIAKVPSDFVGQLRIVDRADLHRILLESLDESTVHVSSPVTSASPDGTVIIGSSSPDTDSPGEHSGPSRQRFDLIIGADGLHSVVREAVEPGIGARYSGYSCWRGITDRPVDLHGAAGETVGRGLRFGIAPLKDGRVYWFAVANMGQWASFAYEKDAVRDLFSGWHAPIAELIESTSSQRILRTAIQDLDTALSTFHRGRIVLLGDAAHAMTPNLGQGGGQALEDAATLTAILTPSLKESARSSAFATPAEDVITSALERYDRLRRRRTQSIAKKSRMIGALFQMDSRPLVGFRDALLSTVPSRVIAAQAASVQRWAPPGR